MIDKEQEIFNSVADILRQKYSDIFIIGEEITSAPSVFPAVSIIQIDNYINHKYATFNSRENVAVEEYKVEVFCNRISGRSVQTKEITSTISDVMNKLGYRRTFCNPVINADATISRRISRYVKNNVIN